VQDSITIASDSSSLNLQQIIIEFDDHIGKEERNKNKEE